MQVLGSKVKPQPAPPHVIFEALTEPRRRDGRDWLRLLDDEIDPAVLTATPPSQVTWSSIWPKRPRAQVQFDIEPDGMGSRLRWTLLDIDDPGPDALGHMRKRLQVLINAELRFSLGQ